MFGRGAGAGRLRAASTAATNAFDRSAGRLASHADSISLTRTVSAARRAFSHFECLVTSSSRTGIGWAGYEKAARWYGRPVEGRSGGLDVLCASALGALLDIELDLLAAGETIEVQGSSQAVAMEEVFLPILGGDEAEAAIGDDLLDGTGGHSDLQCFPNWESTTHGPFEKGSDHAELRRELRRDPTLAQMFEFVEGQGVVTHFLIHRP
jgi:hypothetical protein